MKRNFSAILCMIFLITFLLPPQAVFAASESTAPLPGYIIVANNLGKADTVYVYGLNPGDLVKVYGSASGSTILAYTIVPNNKSDATISIDQLGTSAGSVYVSVINKGKTESSRTRSDYDGEPVSGAPAADNITVANNAGKADTIYICGLDARDVVKVYDAPVKGKLLATRTAASGMDDMTITISQLGVAAGSIYVSVTSKNKLESGRVQVPYSAETLSDAPSADDVTVTNNVKGSDTVYVCGLNEKDTVRVYNAASGGKMLGSRTVASNGSDVTISISQLGSAAGYIYVSVTSAEKAESARTRVGYPAEPGSDAPPAVNIMATNNAGKSDTVYVIGLAAGDVVKVYSAAEKGNLLGSATASSSSSDATVTVAQLGTGAGKVFVSVTSAGKTESARTEAAYYAEMKSYPPSVNDITVTNNVGKPDTVYVKNLNGGDIVKVYSEYTGGALLGSKTASSTGTDATISIAQLGSSSGYVYVAVISGGKSESARVAVNYDAEPVSGALSANNISITNNAGAPDTVYVSGLTSGDAVKLYNSQNGGTLLGSATVPASKTGVTITVAQLGTAAGNIYVTVTKPGSQESSRIKASFSQEGESPAPGINNIIVTNNVGKADTVYVGGLAGNDVVNVYDSEVQGTLLGTASVQSSGTYAVVTIAQLGTGEGTVHVTVTSAGKAESARVAAAYKGESVSDNINADNISVTNNAGISDTVCVFGLTAGDVVKVYDSAQGGTLIGSGTVQSTASDASVSIPQLGTAAGSVYVTVTSSNKSESGRIKADYDAETASPAPSSDNIIVRNNIAGTPDTIYVAELKAGDIVRVYSAATQGTLLGSAVVSGTNTDATISVAQLGSGAGSVYVTVTNSGKLESRRTEAVYSEEGKTPAPLPENITVTNNAGASDTVYVSGLTANDVVRVYDSPRGGALLGTATVSVYSSNAAVSVTQLGSTAGSVYVSVTGTNRSESGRVQADYPAEPSSSGPDRSNITIINNAGAADTIKVTGLTAGDVVKVYDSAKGGNQIGTATATDGTSVTITIAQLGTAAGSAYVTVTSANRLESGRTQADYPAEGISGAPDPDSITINNNSGAPDIVKVTGLTSADVIKVYDAERGGNLLGTATTGTYASEASVSIQQLGPTSGSVYVTVTSINKSESARTGAAYAAEPASSEIKAENITVVNNAGLADTVNVTGLTAGDMVKVYDRAAGGNLLGSATVQSSGTGAAVSIAQLGSEAGTVYVSVVSANKAESGRTAAGYPAEARTAAPAVSDISVLNNAGIASAIVVTGLKDYDVVKVYDAANGGTLLGSGTVAVYRTELTISVSQLGYSGGSIYVSVTGTGKLESSRTEAVYEAKAATPAPSAAEINIVNNAGIPDTVTVSGLEAGTVLKVYAQASGGVAVGTAEVPSGSMEATVSITQLGATAGTVYASLTAPGKTESGRTRADYTAEGVSEPIAAENITVSNNSGIADTITITGLSDYDVVKVYNASVGGTRLAVATAAANSISTVITYSQLGTGAGSIYISVTGVGKTESGRTRIDYAAESTAAAASNITIVNNAGIADTITVAGLAENDLVKVYDAPVSGNLLGTALVAPGSGRVTIQIQQLTVASGSVYISVTNFGKAESSRTKANYIAEQSTTAPYLGDIYAVNNSGMDDMVAVANLLPGDVVKVYDSPTGGSLLGYSSAAADSTMAVVTVSQFGTGAGSVYVSLTTKGKNESGRTEAFYVSEGTSTSPYLGDIYVANNVGIADTIMFTGLIPGDVVKAYSAASGGSLLGYATVASGGDQATISIAQLGTAAGSVYVSLTEPGKAESARVRVDYVSEQTTNAPYEGNVTVANNTGSPDTITVTGLAPGDLVKVFDSPAGGNLLGNATVASGAAKVVITVNQLGMSPGSVYISVTNTGKTESARTKVDYVSEI